MAKNLKTVPYTRSKNRLRQFKPSCCKQGLFMLLFLIMKTTIPSFLLCFFHDFYMKNICNLMSFFNFTAFLQLHPPQHCAINKPSLKIRQPAEKSHGLSTYFSPSGRFRNFLFCSTTCCQNCQGIR